MIHRKTPLRNLKELPSFREAGIDIDWLEREVPSWGLMTVEDFLGVVQASPEAIAKASGASPEALERLFSEASAQLVPPENLDLLATIPARREAFGVPSDSSPVGFDPAGADRFEVANRVFLTEAVASSVSLIDGCLPAARDQGARPTCTVFATVAVLEYLLCRFRGESSDLSEQYLFWLVSQERGLSGDNRAELRDVFEIARDLGSCTEQNWPYEGDDRPNNPTHGNPPDRMACAADAALHRFSDVRPIQDPTDLGALRDLLTSDHPVAVEIPIFKSYRVKSLFTSGQLVLTPDTRVVDSHVIVLVGFHFDPADPSNDRFLVRNSEGDDWGRESGMRFGHGTIVPEYLRRFARKAWFGTI